VLETLREMVRRTDEGRAREDEAERGMKGRNLLTTDVIYFAEIARYLGWVVSIFQCFIHVPSSSMPPYIYHPSRSIHRVPSIARRWQISLRAILLMGCELYDAEKN